MNFSRLGAFEGLCDMCLSEARAGRRPDDLRGRTEAGTPGSFGAAESNRLTENTRRETK